MAHKKVRCSRNGRTAILSDAESKYSAAKINAGSIIVRQVGTKFTRATTWEWARISLFFLINGVVKYERLDKTRKKVSVYAA